VAGVTFDRLDPAAVRSNLDHAREQVARAATVAGRDGAEVEILAAVKYIPADELDVLAEAGIELVGENRAQDLEDKVGLHPGQFTWDFIGQLQSRKVKQILPHVRYIHSVASDSVLAQLAKHAPPTTEVLVEVNVAGETGKGGVAPNELAAFLERCPVAVVGLMTMPPLARSPEDNRAHFAALRELSDRHGLHHLSMGTSQDYVVAVEEGATIVRLGTCLYRRGAP
jgi:pyridoxal phosphate enzyme (YggS family)